MFRLSIFYLAIVFCSVYAGKNDQYAGYSVYGVQLRDRSDQLFLHDLEDIVNVDVWAHGYPGESDALVMVAPEDRIFVLDWLDSKDMTHYLHLSDVAQVSSDVCVLLENMIMKYERMMNEFISMDHFIRVRIRPLEGTGFIADIASCTTSSGEWTLDEHDEGLHSWRNTRSRTGRLLPFENYPRHDEVNEYLESIAAQYPDIVTLVDAGLSFEGREIKYLRISTTNFENPNKPVYFMDAMIHAREWVTTPVALYAIHRLVEDLREQDRDLLEDIDWIILPVVNPDGYEFTHTTTRMWRRTRSYYPLLNDTCYGVDANRNFDVNFNTLGVSSSPCSDTFPGHETFSEPETRIVRDILHEHVERTQIYMNIHSHGNWILFGFGNTTLPDGGVHIYQVGATMGAVMDALKLPQATFYRVGNSGLILYPTSGSAQDYAQYIGVPFSYTLELPGYGFAFLVPPQFINHINSETWEGIAATARLSRSYFNARLGL